MGNLSRNLDDMLFDYMSWTVTGKAKVEMKKSNDGRVRVSAVHYLLVSCVKSGPTL